MDKFTTNKPLEFDLEINVTCPLSHATAENAVDILSSLRTYRFHNVPDLCAHLRTAHDFELDNVNSIHLFLQEYLDTLKHYASDGRVMISQSQDLEERKRLHAKKLQDALDVQLNTLSNIAAVGNGASGSQKDYECPFCSFCTDGSDGIPKLALILEHMEHYHKHRIDPKQMVYIPEYLSTLKRKFKSELKCTYCERIFKDKETLRKHMKKKFHGVVLNPLIDTSNPNDLRKPSVIHKNNRNYDKFYIENYEQYGKSWRDPVNSGRSRTSFMSQTSSLAGSDHIEGEEDEDAEGEDNNDVDEWDEQIFANCLFCSEEFPLDVITSHFHESHNFKFEELSSDFYDRVKIVNYIRRVVLYESKCCSCCKEFDSVDKVYDHFKENPVCCVALKDKDEWKNTIYLMPTVEDDGLLLCLEGDENDFESDDENETLLEGMRKSLTIEPGHFSTNI